MTKYDIISLNMTPERQQAISEFENVKSAFTDFCRFEGEQKDRQQQKEAFLSGIDYTPNYDYEKLDDLRYDDKLTKKKTAIYKSVFELEAAKLEKGVDLQELKLYSDYHELRLKKIMLVEAARDIYLAPNSSELETAKKVFMDLNIEVYGDFDVSRYRSMISTECNYAELFLASSEKSLNVKNELIAYLDNSKRYNVKEESLISDENLIKLHDVVSCRYGDVVNIIPNTLDSIYYNADQCAKIINDTLSVAKLTELGWKSVVDPLALHVSTSKHLIKLPLDTRRNSNELRRLVLHEQEVHARRAENGKKSGLKPLSGGTANYADIEEGLGVLLECAIAGSLNNKSFNRARDRYITAGLALGSDDKVPRNARQVHDILWRMFAIRNSKDGDISDNDIKKAKEDAYVHVEDAFRGTSFWMSGVIYSKLKVYYEGLEKNAKFFSDNINNIDEMLDIAMIGKYDHTNKSERDAINKILARKNVIEEIK